MSSMSLNPAQGLTSLLKAGHKHYNQGSTTSQNIQAIQQLSSTLHTSLGPQGRNKLVLNHLSQTIVTSDCAAILKELEIQHPAAKMVQLAAQRQEDECGDGTNLLVSFAGELLGETESLLHMGLHVSEIVQGYRKASEFLQKTLPTLVVGQVEDPRNHQELERVCRPVLAAKQAEFLAPLIAEACLATVDSSKTRISISKENVRVAKILGGNVNSSEVIKGMVLLRGAETTLTNVTNAKITVFGCGIEASGTEAKGTVLMKNADDLMNYNKSEEWKMDEVIKAIAESGTKVIVSGGTVSEMALHFIEKYGMMCIKVASKWDLRRLCSASRSSALVRLGPATPDEMGFCDHVFVKEIGGKNVTIFSQNKSAKDDCRIATILLRASTSSVLNDLDRAVDDGVSACSAACKDPRLLAGAGATEMELSQQIKKFGDTCPGLDQYAIRAFAKALQLVPRILAQNSGQDHTEVLAALGAAHANGQKSAGIDITGANHGVCDAGSSIVDLFRTKESAFRLAVDATLTVLRVDQIIMSKPAGGGK